MATDHTPDIEMQRRADILRIALMAFARTTLGSERAIAESLADQAELMAEVAQ